MINYYLITKPGIVFGNLFTLAAGFLLASRGHFQPLLFLETLLGLGFVMASACVFNNYIDRHIDQKMERTKNRALASGTVSKGHALTFAVILLLLGISILIIFTNLLSVAIALFGFFDYVFLYSFWKKHTIYGTAIGSIAGAIPPVVGYTAISNQLDLGAWLLFFLLVLWQMPHFYAISLYHLEDYKKASLPLLPLEKGLFKTKLHMTCYILAFIPTALLLTYFNYTGYLYFTIILFLGLAWLILSFRGFNRRDTSRWGKEMFQLSLVIIGAICLLIPLDALPLH